VNVLKNYYWISFQFTISPKLFSCVSKRNKDLSDIRKSSKIEIFTDSKKELEKYEFSITC